MANINRQTRMEQLRNEKNMRTNKEKIELKAKFFKICEDMILKEGGRTGRGEPDLDEYDSVISELEHAGMKDVVKQGLDSIMDLWADLGYVDMYEEKKKRGEL